MSLPLFEVYAEGERRRLEREARQELDRRLPVTRHTADRRTSRRLRRYAGNLLIASGERLRGYPTPSHRHSRLRP